MSIIYCKRCDDDYDSDKHTDVLCPHCMRDLDTWDDGEIWTASIAGNDYVGVGETEDEAIKHLVEAL
jgi:uncharacterized Zn ribbon protein